MLPSQILENGWCQGFLALDEDGCVVSLDSPEATRYCISGALRASNISEMEFSKLINIVDDKIEEMGFITRTHYNDADERTQKEVVEFVKQCEIAIGLNSE